MWGAPFPLKTYNTSSTVMTFLGQLARQRGILAVSLGDGKLTLTRSGTSRAGAALELGKNIKSGQGNFSNADRFSHYRFKGQGVVPLNQKLDLDDPGGVDKAHLENHKKLLNPKAQATDPAITRHRPKVLMAEQAGDQASLETRARWEATVRAGRSRRARYQVKGWEAAPGSLWRVNQLVKVTDSLLGLSGDYLIEKLEYSLAEDGGGVTNISVVHPDAYAAEPVNDKAGQILGQIDL